MIVTRREAIKLGISSLAAGCCSSDLSNRAWNNAINTDGVDPETISEPRSLEELVQLVKRADSSGRRVRMVGSGHSFSDVAFTSDHLLKPLQLDASLEVPAEQLNDKWSADRAKLVRVESGRTIRQLNPYLEGKGRALMNLGGYDAQTIIGAAMTGTHGSGLDYGPIASQIKSLQLVTTGGEVLQIEPAKDPITDPSKFPGYLKTHRGQVPAKLAIDDELFNAVVVSLGSMGVVYAAVIETAPKFWLREARTKIAWSKLIGPGGFLRTLVDTEKPPTEAQLPDYYEIYFNPYPIKGDHSCLLTARYKLTEEPTNLTPAERKRGRLGLPPIEALAYITNQGAALADYMDDHAKLVPQMIEDQLNVLRDSSFVDISHRVFHLGPANNIRVLGIEMGFDLKQTIDVVEHVFEKADELRTSREWMHSACPSIRFVAASDAHLAMMSGRKTAMLEMGMLVSAHGDRGLLEEYERTFIADPFKGRPHWGLDLNMLRSFDAVRRLYPDSADRWLAKFREINSKGTFDGHFTDRLGISVRPS